MKTLCAAIASAAVLGATLVATTGVSVAAVDGVTSVTKADPRGDFNRGPEGDGYPTFTKRERATTDVTRATVTVDQAAQTLRVTYRLADFRTAAGDKQFFNVTVATPGTQRDYIDLTWFRNAERVRAVTATEDDVTFAPCRGATIQARYRKDTMTMIAPLSCLAGKDEAKITVSSTLNNNVWRYGIRDVDILTDQVTFARTWDLTPLG